MPSLTFLGRQWCVSSDDLVFPSAFELLVQMLWLAGLVMSYAFSRGSLSCDTGGTMEYFYFATFGIDVADLIITMAVLCISMRGSIRNSYPRRHIWVPMFLKLLFYIAEMVWVCLSTYWIFGHHFDCGSTVQWTVRTTLMWSWLLRVLKIAGSILTLCPWKSYKPTSDGPSDLAQGNDRLTALGEQAVSRWERRCRRLFCCIAEEPDVQNAFTDVASIAAEYFDVDLVPTDVLAGFMLLMRRENSLEEHGSSLINPLNPSNRSRVGPINPIVMPKEKEWMNLPNMAHYMRYAIAIYGSLSYVAANPCCGPCRICCQSRCSCGQKPSEDHDDRCESNKAAIKSWTNLTDDDILHVSFRNTKTETPFFVAIDRSKNAVVVAIRGTWSARDGLADFTGRGVRINIPGAEESYCHEAVLGRATYLYEQLTTKRIIENGFSQLDSNSNLVITGHSLGSAVASVLAILLKPHYPWLRCFAFSPMGCTLDPTASRYTEDFVCSPTLGMDMIARIDMKTLLDLKCNLLQALLDSEAPKYEVLAKGALRFLYCCCILGRSSGSEKALLTKRRRRYVGSGPILHIDVRLEESLEDAHTDLRTVRDSHWPLKPPGTLLHIVEADRPGQSSKQPTYEAYWIDTGTLSRIELSPTMVSDHLPNNVLAALDQMVKKGIEPQ